MIKYLFLSLVLLTGCDQKPNKSYNVAIFVNGQPMQVYTNLANKPDCFQGTTRIIKNDGSEVVTTLPVFVQENK